MRCNTGVSPIWLADAHLIAEQVELLMVTGMLRRNKYIHKTPIPTKFKLGTGHMTFWFDKLLYLQKRLKAIKSEIGRRGFKVMERDIILDGFPNIYLNDWSPTIEDSQIVRQRIVDKVLKKNPGFWRYERIPISNIESFVHNIQNSELFYV